MERYCSIRKPSSSEMARNLTKPGPVNASRAHKEAVLNRKKLKRKIKQQKRKIFVGGLNIHTKKTDIAEYFSTFGIVKYVDLARGRVTRARRGFCFVTFSNEEAATNASEQKFHFFDGQRVEVKKAVPKIIKGQKEFFDSRLKIANNCADLDRFSFFEFKLTGTQCGYEYFNKTIENLKAI